MYITARNGKYRAFERYKTPDGKVHKASVTMVRNTPQSRSQARRALETIIAGKSSANSEITLKTLVDAYIEDQKRTVKASTWARNEASLRRLIHVIGDVPVKQLSAGLIRSRISAYTSDPTKYNNYVRHLKAALNWGFANDFLPDRTCIDKLQKKKAPSARSKIQDKYLEKEELEAVIDALSPFYALIVKFQALTGLRIGELIALEDKDVTQDYIYVTKTRDVRNRVTTSPKSEDSNRKVFIQPELADVIADIRKLTKTNKLRTGKRSKLFVIGTFGDPLSYSKFNRIFADATEKVLNRRLTTHALRHTHVSLLAEAGVPLETITRRIGHADSKITKEIYLHITQKMQEKENEMLSAVAIF